MLRRLLPLLVLLSFAFQVQAAKLPLLMSASIGYGVVVPDGTGLPAATTYGIRTVLPLPHGWSSLQDIGFTTGLAAFQPAPRWAGDVSHEIVPGGLRLALSYGLRFNPPYSGASPSLSVIGGPLLVRPIKGFGGFGLMAACGYNLQSRAFTVGPALIMAFNLRGEKS